MAPIGVSDRAGEAMTRVIINIMTLAANSIEATVTKASCMPAYHVTISAIYRLSQQYLWACRRARDDTRIYHFAQPEDSVTSHLSNIKAGETLVSSICVPDVILAKQ